MIRSLKSLFSSSGLTSANLEERRVALEAAKKTAADTERAEIARLGALQNAARQQQREAVAEAERVFAARHEEIDRALAADIIATIYPIVAAFLATPRAAAVELIAAWNALEARARVEIGDSLAGKHIALAMLATMGVDALARGGNDRFWSFVRGTSRGPTATIESGAGPAAVEQSLRELEAMLANALALADTPQDAERLAVMQATATVNRFPDVLEAHDSKVRANAEEAARPAREAHTAKWIADQAALSSRSIPNRLA